MVKNPPASAGDVNLIPGSGKSPGGGNDNPLQYSFLRNPMDRGSWWAAIHGGHKRIEHFLVTNQQTGTRTSLFKKINETLKILAGVCLIQVYKIMILLI